MSKNQFKRGGKRIYNFFKGGACAGLAGTSGCISLSFSILAVLFSLTYVGYPVGMLCLLVASATAAFALSAKVEMEEAFHLALENKI